MGTVIAISWIMSALLAVVGAIVCVLCRMFKSLHHAEVEAMKQSGRWEGEEEYMQIFRVARAERELADNVRYARYASIGFWISATGTAALIFLSRF